MNKLISKIVGVALGLTLAVGTGVAIATNSRNISKADAAETLDYTLDGTTTGGSSGYDTESSIDQGDVSWSVVGNTTMSPWRIGGKTMSGVSRLVKSTTIVSTGNITKVELSVGTASSITVNSLKLYVGTSAGGSETSTVTQSFAANSTITFNRPSGADWTGKYFTIDFNVSVSGTSNKFVQFKFAKFYREIQEQTITGISVADVTLYAGQTVAPEVTAQPNGATLPNDLSYSLSSVSPAGCVTVDSSTGELTGVSAGTATLTVTSGGNASLTDTATVTVSNYPLSGITVGKQYALVAAEYDYELSGISTTSTKYGIASAFNGTPSCDNPVEIENGSRAGSVAFAFNGAYLAWTSGNSLITQSSISDSSSWVVTYENGEYTVINLSTYHEASKRHLRYNANSGTERFACYESGQTAISFYEVTGAALTDFTIDASISVYKTGTATIDVTYTPADATDKTLTWTTSDATVATVADGVVTGVEVGTCTVTASKVIGGVTVERTCAVTVLNNKAAHLGTSADPFDINDAVNVANGVFTQTSNGTAVDLANTYYYVKGILTKYVTRTTSQLTFWLGDEASQQSAATGGFEIFKAAKVYGENLADAYTADSEVVRDFAVGYTIKASGKLKNYNGTPEMDTGGFIYYNSYIQVRKYAEAFNTALEAVCDANGNTVAADLESAWSAQATAYAALDATLEQPILKNATAKTTSNATAVELCAAKYDYILGKYGTSTLSNFINRTVAPSSANARFAAIESNNAALVVVAITAFVGITFVGGYFLLRKKKEN